MVIGDGRRYLENSANTFDITVIDPPPPVQAASSSLLYSVEFYEAAKLPLKAQQDLVEWGPFHTPAEQLGKVLSEEVQLGELLRQSRSEMTV